MTAETDALTSLSLRVSELERGMAELGNPDPDCRCGHCAALRFHISAQAQTRGEPAPKPPVEFTPPEGIP